MEGVAWRGGRGADYTHIAWGKAIYYYVLNFHWNGKLLEIDWKTVIKGIPVKLIGKITKDGQIKCFEQNNITLIYQSTRPNRHIISVLIIKLFNRYD